MIITKTSKNMYKVTQDASDEEKLNKLFDKIYPESSDKLNPHLKFIKKKSLFVDMLMDKFISEIEVDGKVNIITTGAYDVKIFVMNSTLKELPGISFSFD